MNIACNFIGDTIQNDNILHINIISDIMLDLYLKQMVQEAFQDLGYKAEVKYIRIQEVMGEENLKSIKGSDLNIIWINYENYMFENQNSYWLTSDEKESTMTYLFEYMQVLYTNLKCITSAQMIWFGFEDYYNHVFIEIGNVLEEENMIDHLNHKMKSLLGQEVAVIDLKRLIASVGINSAYDLLGKYRWEAPYSRSLLMLAAKEIIKQYLVFHGGTKKCIVLDCDNVLWKGTISEDGIYNIKIGGTEGKFYKEFQKYMKSLYKLGVILVICSKNDLSDVLDVFENNSEMILKKEDIAVFEVNWEPKTEGIKRIAEKLNIGLEHMVFIDDSVFEIEAVKKVLPEVDTILFRKNNLYEQLAMFHLSVNIDSSEIERRKKTYQMNEVRKKFREGYNDYAEYLKALKMKVEYDIPENLFRIAELSQRVNKASNGRRYRSQELEKMIAEGKYYLFSVRLSDKFGDLGTVGAMGVLKTEEGYLLDLFCVSCRALGRNIEDRMIAFVKNKYQLNKVYFKTTYKNDSLKKLLEQHFLLIS